MERVVVHSRHPPQIKTIILGREGTLTTAQTPLPPIGVELRIKVREGPKKVGGIGSPQWTCRT